MKERKVSSKCAIGLMPPTRVLSSCESLTVSTDAPKKDEGASVLHYTRSKEQNELLGLSEVSSVDIGFVCSFLASVYIYIVLCNLIMNIFSNCIHISYI